MLLALTPNKIGISHGLWQFFRMVPQAFHSSNFWTAVCLCSGFPSVVTVTNIWNSQWKSAIKKKFVVKTPQDLILALPYSARSLAPERTTCTALLHLLVLWHAKNVWTSTGWAGAWIDKNRRFPEAAFSHSVSQPCLVRPCQVTSQNRRQENPPIVLLTQALSETHSLVKLIT